MGIHIVDAQKAVIFIVNSAVYADAVNILLVSGFSTAYIPAHIPAQNRRLKSTTSD
jgi:hypothetical protein